MRSDLAATAIWRPSYHAPHWASSWPSAPSGINLLLIILTSSKYLTTSNTIISAEYWLDYAIHISKTNPSQWRSTDGTDPWSGTRTRQRGDVEKSLRRTSTRCWLWSSSEPALSCSCTARSAPCNTARCSKTDCRLLRAFSTLVRTSVVK